MSASVMRNACQQNPDLEQLFWPRTNLLNHNVDLVVTAMYTLELKLKICQRDVPFHDLDMCFGQLLSWWHRKIFNIRKHSKSWTCIYTATACFTAYNIKQWTWFTDQLHSGRQSLKKLFFCSDGAYEFSVWTKVQQFQLCLLRFFFRVAVTHIVTGQSDDVIRRSKFQACWAVMHTSILVEVVVWVQMRQIVFSHQSAITSNHRPSIKWIITRNVLWTQLRYEWKPGFSRNECTCVWTCTCTYMYMYMYISMYVQYHGFYIHAKCVMKQPFGSDISMIQQSCKHVVISLIDHRTSENSNFQLKQAIFYHEPHLISLKFWIRIQDSILNPNSPW